MKLSPSIVLLGLVAAAYSRPIENIEDRGITDSIHAGWNKVKAKFHHSQSSAATDAAQDASLSTRALSEATTEKTTGNGVREVHDVRRSQSGQEIASGFSQIGAGISGAAASAGDAVAAPFKAAGHEIAKPFVAAKNSAEDVVNGVEGAAAGAKEGYENSQ